MLSFEQQEFAEIYFTKAMEHYIYREKRHARKNATIKIPTGTPNEFLVMFVVNDEKFIQAIKGVPEVHVAVSVFTSNRTISSLRLMTKEKGYSTQFLMEEFNLDEKNANLFAIAFDIYNRRRD